MTFMSSMTLRSVYRHFADADDFADEETIVVDHAVVVELAQAFHP
jgi:hypothetical protein